MPIGIKVFLAGSIEMGKAEDWQARVEKFFDFLSDVTLYNPRRDDWNNAWKQTIDDENFVGQVEWELQNLEDSDFIFMYFDPKTLSPITLVEFGLYVRCSPEKMIVCCPDGFWKKGNLQVTGRKYGVTIYDSLQEALPALHIRMTEHVLQEEADKIKKLT
jgi:hypothetical protein